MSSYFLAHINIHQPAAYEQYLAGFDEIFARYQGRVLAVEDHATVLEGKWATQRTVLIQFPNTAELRRWYDSSEYQRLAEFRRRASTADIVIIEGCD